MKPVYQCDYCDFQGTMEVVMKHEIECGRNPENIEKQRKINWIEKHCPHRDLCYDEYYPYWGCRKDGYTGRLAKDCEATLDCLQYCKGEDLWENM